MMKYGGQATDTTGSLLQAVYENFHLESGLLGPTNEFPECAYEYITNTWVIQTYAACRLVQITATGATTEIPAP